jgi:hypothetical protein
MKAVQKWPNETVERKTNDGFQLPPIEPARIIIALVTECTMQDQESRLHKKLGTATGAID